jgi:hypothetical protein
VFTKILIVSFYQLIRWLADRDTSLALASGRDSGRCGVEPAEKMPRRWIDSHASVSSGTGRRMLLSVCARVDSPCRPTHPQVSSRLVLACTRMRMRRCSSVGTETRDTQPPAFYSHVAGLNPIPGDRTAGAVDTCRRAAHIGNSDSAGDSSVTKRI